MTKLEAVNKMLESIGVRHVAALNTDGISFAAQAERVLDRQSSSIQEKGWYENTRNDVELTPDPVKGTIDAGTDTLDVDGVGPSENLNLTVRGGNLWNIDDDTDLFTDTVHVRIVAELDWDDLPLYLQTHIEAEAAKEFQRRIKKDPQADAFLRDEASSALMSARKGSQRNAGTNVLTTTYAATVLGTRTGYNPGR